MPPIGFEVLCTTSPIVASWTAEWYFVRRSMSGRAMLYRSVVASAVAKVVATDPSCETGLTACQILPDPSDSAPVVRHLPQHR